MFANVMLQALHAIMPDHKPQLQRTKPPPQLNVPVAVIDHCPRLSRLVAQVLRQNRKRLNQVLAVGDIETIAVESCKHPLVRIESVAVGKLDAVMNKPKFG